MGLGRLGREASCAISLMNADIIIPINLISYPSSGDNGKPILSTFGLARPLSFIDQVEGHSLIFVS